MTAAPALVITLPGAPINAQFSVLPGSAQIGQILLAMTADQRQSYRDAMAGLDDMSDIAIRSRQEWASASDDFGLFLGNLLFGSTTDGRLASLFGQARANTIAPYSYNLTPVGLGGVLTDA